MSQNDNWTFTVEGMGPTHNVGCAKDASKIALDMLHALEAAGHRLLQVRYTSARGEENWRDSNTRDMHEELYISCNSPHEELVESAASKQVTESVGKGKRKKEQLDG